MRRPGDVSPRLPLDSLSSPNVSCLELHLPVAPPAPLRMREPPTCHLYLRFSLGEVSRRATRPSSPCTRTTRARRSLTALERHLASRHLFPRRGWRSHLQLARRRNPRAPLVWGEMGREVEPPRMLIAGRCTTPHTEGGALLHNGRLGFFSSYRGWMGSTSMSRSSEIG
jgi:hypothetical protein